MTFVPDRSALRYTQSLNVWRPRHLRPPVLTPFLVTYGPHPVLFVDSSHFYIDDVDLL